MECVCMDIWRFQKQLFLRTNCYISLYRFVALYLEASPLPLASCQLTGWLLNLLLFIPKTFILETSRFHFGYPEWPFWWSRGPWGHPTGRSRCPLLSLLGPFEGSPGTHFGHMFVIVLWFWVPNGRQFPDPCFWWSSEGNDARMRCLYVPETSVKRCVLERFHIFHLFTNFGIRGMVLGLMLVSFGDLGNSFSDWWGSWRQTWNFMIFRRFPGGTQVEGTHPLG